MSFPKVVFIGASKFGLRCLERLYASMMCEVVGVVTARKSFKISYSETPVNNVLHADVESYCLSKGIPVYIMDGGMSNPLLFEKIVGLRPDLIIAVGWYHMIPKTWCELAPVYGMHASLLPDYSGGAPLVWAIINGETKTGITLFKFDQGVDSGPIVGQRITPIHFEDDIAVLYARIEDLGLELIDEFILEFQKGTVVHQCQDESRRRFFPQRSPKDGLIDWSLSAKAIYDFVRAQTAPYPGAFTYLCGNKLVIYAGAIVQFEKKVSDLEGSFRAIGKNIAVCCGDEFWFLLKKIEYEGRLFVGEEIKELLDLSNKVRFGYE